MPTEARQRSRACSSSRAEAGRMVMNERSETINAAAPPLAPVIMVCSRTSSFSPKMRCVPERNWTPSKINIDNSDGSNSPGSIGIISRQEQYPVKYGARPEPKKAFAITQLGDGADTKTDARKASVIQLSKSEDARVTAALGSLPRGACRSPCRRSRTPWPYRR